MRREDTPPACGSLVLPLLGNSASAQQLACSAPLKPQQVAELLLGRKNRGCLGVSETQFLNFLESPARSAALFLTAHRLRMPRASYSRQRAQECQSMDVGSAQRTWRACARCRTY